MTAKPHPLKGRKRSKESIAKMLATRKAIREMQKAGKPPIAPKKTAKGKRVEARTMEQLTRDVDEAIWCLGKAVAGTREKIRTGQISLTDVTDEETYLYMAIRYLHGGLR